MGYEIRADYDQIFFLPPHVEVQVGHDHLSRFIPDFLDSLDSAPVPLHEDPTGVTRHHLKADAGFWKSFLVDGGAGAEVCSGTGQKKRDVCLACIRWWVALHGDLFEVSGDIPRFVKSAKALKVLTSQHNEGETGIPLETGRRIPGTRDGLTDPSFEN